MDCNILFEDKHILVAVKPQGIPVQPDKTGDADLLSALENCCHQPLGLVHRLDRPVGGVMIFAKTKTAEAFLSKELQEGQLKKMYLTVLCGKLPQEKGILKDFLRKNTRTNLSEVVPEGAKGSKKAILQYARLGERETEYGCLTLAKITLFTGRHHQIRVQTSHAGVPIWGDKKYHPSFRKKGRTEIALWSYGLSGIHPETKEEFAFSALPEKEPFSFFSEEMGNL